MGDQATKPSSGNRKHTERMNPLFQRVWTQSSVVITLDVSRVRPHPRPLSRLAGEGSRDDPVALAEKSHRLGCLPAGFV